MLLTNLRRFVASTDAPHINSTADKFERAAGRTSLRRAAQRGDGGRVALERQAQQAQRGQRGRLLGGAPGRVAPLRQQRVHAARQQAWPAQRCLTSCSGVDQKTLSLY